MAPATTPPPHWFDAATTKAAGLAVVARGDQLTQLSPSTYMVRSQSTPDRSYTVTVSGSRTTCTCEHVQEAAEAGIRHECLHVTAVKLRESLQTTPTDDKAACPKCNGVNTVGAGRRFNKSGAVRRYECRDCASFFTDRDGFQRRRSDPEKIALALDLYYRGLSVRKVAEHFQQVHGLNVSHMTVYRWVTAYGRLAADWMDRQGAATGARWHVDETVVKVDGAHRYLWNVLDADSRFLLATHVSQNRSLTNTRAPLKKAKAATPDRPREVFTDGMMAYPKAVLKELGGIRKGVPGIWNPHVRVPSIRAPESNNRVERLHGSEKERVKVMRGFDGDKGCADLMEGWRVHYNMVREHQALGKTPGEAAGLAPIGGFRWLEVLKAALSDDLLQASGEA